MVGVGCFAAKTRKYNKKPFFKDNTGNKKTVFVLLVDHDQKWMGQEKQKKMAEDVNYIPRTEEFRKTR